MVPLLPLPSTTDQVTEGSRSSVASKWTREPFGGNIYFAGDGAYIA